MPKRFLLRSLVLLAWLCLFVTPGRSQSGSKTATPCSQCECVQPGSHNGDPCNPGVVDIDPAQVDVCHNAGHGRCAMNGANLCELDPIPSGNPCNGQKGVCNGAGQCRCRDNGDCDGGKVCQSNGACGFVCQVDADCKLPNLRCSNHQCVDKPPCGGCQKCPPSS